MQALRGVRLVLNCAGPFSKTADPLLRVCLAAKAHYLDITGEIYVLEGAHRYDAGAKAAGVVLCPGAGFDVVSDPPGPPLYQTRTPTLDFMQ